MILYIALCDKWGIVKRVIRSVPIGIVNEGKDVRLLFEDREKLDVLLCGQSGPEDSPRLPMKIEGNPLVYVTVRNIESQLLFLAYDVDGDASDLSRLVELVLSSMAAVRETTGQEEYGAGYYEIQKLNSQLINYQRTQAKTNAQLQRLLEEAWKAKGLIEMLERDTLTGLYTEKAFCERASGVLHAHPQQEYDIIAVDIEQFKIVNDVFGTMTGDQLLRDLSATLIGFQTDELKLMTRARADTFFMLLVREKSYEVLDRSICSFLENYPLLMRLQIKTGIYRIEERELAVERMCDRALLAAVSIKGNYDCRMIQFNDKMHEKMMMEQKIVNTMVESLEKGEFMVYLQPKVEIDTGRIIGAEALVRWNHPKLGIISPCDFIPVFEQNGFIYTVDLYVWEKACSMMRAWRMAGLTEIPVSVNVSRTDLYHEDLPDRLVQLTETYGLSPQALHLEITESVYVRDASQMLISIKRLKKAGFMIEMDDFGSGYSSLNILYELPIDVMKLDMMFLGRADHESRRQTVMRLVINLAKELNLQIIAEGVETEEQAQLLKCLGCGLAQGYLYGRPVPEPEFTRCLPMKEIKKET
ncbi:putative bifunctional diguanylate cyclase/phosphodiesterase [Enterocloster citroniae]|uniref:putative bifunctional diguanylate cyclase/phosphodiesterase n=1 Tax=Enterocloster citroniae TaxID=358743 RepID=UPI00189AE70F|nr:GGDEF domain-containing phosphodiesterase [Enterocloster citroniae]